ncbi:MAG: FAD:protein FMN transferase [Candidatus Thermoplasmatota archaeon]
MTTSVTKTTIDASAGKSLAFRCCDTTWTLHADGPDSDAALAAGQHEALRLERILNAFDPASAVSRLNREGTVEDPIVAAVVRRALEVSARTRGAFDFRQGRLEHAVKAHLRTGGPAEFPPPLANHVEVIGDRVRIDAPLDLNGIAKGWMADRVRERMVEAGAVQAFVDAGGDLTPPPGPVAVESPAGALLAVLRTPWSIATSGNVKRRRGAVDHIYDPRSGHVGARHEQVTVLSSRDTAEADALATTLCSLPREDAWRLADQWGGVEALFVHRGKVWWTRGFLSHAE